jgi:hypothetical protein
MIATALATPPLIIYRSADREGATYALSRDTRDRVRKAFGAQVHLPPRIFIAHETEADYQQIHGSIRRQVAELLTGLPEERLASLGEVRFIDPMSEE